MGAAYLLVSSVVFAVSLMLAGDALEPLVSGKDLNAPIDPEVAKQLLVQLLITLQVAVMLSAPTLVAAPLVAWHGLPVGKALDHERLTPREIEVLTYLSKGFTIKEIANLMGIKWFTVNDHIKSIYKKLNVSSRAEAAVLASKQGLV